jgi:hypothetical protein
LRAWMHSICFFSICPVDCIIINLDSSFKSNSLKQNTKTQKYGPGLYFPT